MKLIMTSAVALAACAVIGVADAAALSCPSRRGTRPFGPTYAVAATGDLGLVGDGALLDVVDLTAQEPLPSIGEVALADVIVGIAVAPAGGRIWVADRSGVSAVDLAVPTRPVLLGRHPVAGELQAVAASGGLVYLADRDLGLRIVDFSVPASPVELGTLPSPGFAWDVAVAPPYAYLADFAGGLRVIDVSVPSAPVEVGEYRPADAPYVLDVELTGELAVVTVWSGDNGSLRTLDLADPVAPRELGVYSLIDGPTALAVAGATAWVAESYYGGIHEVDISDPATPVSAGWSFPADDDFSALAATDRWLLAGVEQIGAFVSDRTGVHGCCSLFATAGPILSVAGDDGRIVVDGGGVRILAAADPDHLVELGAWESYGRADALAVDADHAYLAWGSRLVVLDVSLPAVPVEVASVPSLGGRLYDLELIGDTLLVAQGGAVGVVDVSVPAAPVALATLIIADATRLAVTGDVAVVAINGADNGIAVVDLATPAAPAVVATLALPCPPAAVAAGRELAFVGCATSGVAAVDLALPSAPEVVGWLGRPAAINVGALAVAGSCLFLLEGDGGAGAALLRVVDVADPTAMRSVGVAATGGNAHDLAFVGRKLAVAEGDRGVSVFDPSWCSCGLAREPSLAE